MPTGTEDAQYATYRAEIERLRRDCAELYQVIGVMAEFCPEDPAIIKALDNASDGAVGRPRRHDDLLPFTLPGALEQKRRSMPTDKEIEAAAKMLCYLNGIPECAGSHPDCGPPCTPETCEHGMRDFGDTAKAVLEAAERARHSYLK